MSSQSSSLSRPSGSSFTSCLCSRRHLYKKLFTKEDPIYLHKTLGLLSLLSFVHRYLVVYPRRGDLGFTGSWFDHSTMMLHLALSTSSIIFHVLAHRIFNKPMIIWEEYRLHAIVFTLRCASVYLFAVFFPAAWRGTTLHRLLFYPLVLSHHIVVDEITKRYGSKEGRTTVRSGTNAKDTASWKISILRAYSFYQFLALGSHLIPQYETEAAVGDAGFNTLIAIQSSAFLMTLFRKGLIRDYSHAIWYSLCLIISAYHIARMFPSYIFFGKIVCAFLLRTKLRINKYAIWFLFVVVSLPAMDNAWSTALTAVWDTLAKGDATMLYGNTQSNWGKDMTTTGLSYLKNMRYNVASSYAVYMDMNYDQGYAAITDSVAKYKFTVTMLAMLVGMWVRGGAPGVNNIIGGLLRPVAPAARSVAQRTSSANSRVGSKPAES